MFNISCGAPSWCQVALEKQLYYPGETAAGKLECFFASEKFIKGLKVVFEGQAHVQFGLKNPIIREEKYPSVYTDLLKGLDTNSIVDCEPGKHVYDFCVSIPKKIPASITLDHGYISYWVVAVLELSGENSMIERKKVTIGSHVDLNSYSICKNPISRTEYKSLFFEFSSTPSILIQIKLPQGGYVPSQLITLSVKVQNMSHSVVSGVRFKILQTFKMITQDYHQQHSVLLGKELLLENSGVPSGGEKAWTIQLQVPADALAVDLTACNIIKMQHEIMGTVVLPFPHRNLKIRVPFYLGTVPVTTTTL